MAKEVFKCAHTEVRKISDLLQMQNPKNNNKHPKEQIDRLAKIIDFQGQRSPIVISKRSGFIVKGHGRLFALHKLGWEKAAVDYQEYKTEAEEYADMTADNEIARWAEFDEEKFLADVKNIDLGDFDLLGLKDFKLDLSEPLQPKCDEDDLPENVETRCKPGDIWKLGEHRLMCGDSTDFIAVEKLMNGKKAVAWISDPPYGINHVEVSQEKGQSKGYDKIANDDLQDEELKEFILKVIECSKPFLEKNFAFYMWHAMKMQAYFSQAAAAAAGILFHRQIIWEKERFVFGRGHYHWQHELCLMGWLQGNEPPFYGDRNQTTIWKVGRENDKIHPTQKPVKLYEIPINNHMKKGEIFMEPFGGSGAGIIAAEKTGVACYSMEFEPKYCDNIIARWENYTGKKAELTNGPA